MFFPGDEAILFTLILGSLIYIVFPFLLGFLISFYFLKRIFSSKKGKFYIKSTNTRYYALFGCSIFIGIVCVYIVITLGTLGYIRI